MGKQNTVARTADERAFLAAILDAPDDDAPRLIYADYLLEQGDPRGDFIHVQYQLARLPEHAPEAPALRRQEQDLLAAHGEAWAGPVGTHARSYAFRRGLLEYADLDAGVFLEHAAALLDSAPLT